MLLGSGSLQPLAGRARVFSRADPDWRADRKEGFVRVTTGVTAMGVAAACLWACSPVTRGPSRDRSVITAEEVRSAEVNNAFHLIEHLRPLWLRSRGERSTRLPTEIVVYQDGVMLGDIESLRNIPIELVLSVRALDSTEAMRLPGLGSRHVERAILVETRRGG